MSDNLKKKWSDVCEVQVVVAHSRGLEVNMERGGGGYGDWAQGRTGDIGRL